MTTSTPRRSSQAMSPSLSYAVGNEAAHGQVIEQGPDLGQLVPLAGRESNPHRPAQGIRDKVDLGAQAASGPADGCACAPLLAPAACWCARTMVVSTTVHSHSGSEARKARSQAPTRVKRRK